MKHQQSELVKSSGYFPQLQSFFTMKIPFYISPDAASLLSYSGGIVTEREFYTQRTVTLEYTLLICLKESLQVMNPLFLMCVYVPYLPNCLLRADEWYCVK